MNRQYWKYGVMALAVCAGMATMGMRCQRTPELVEKDLAVLLTAGEVDETAKGVGFLDPSVFLSVDVTIDEIRLVEEDDDRVSVFVGPVTANLLDLVGVLSVLETATVPVGSYVGVELLLSSAEVELVANPGVPQAVSLPDGGLVFVALAIEVTEEDDVLIIDLGGVRIRQENGTFSIEPDVSVSLTDSATAQAVGKVENLDKDNDVFDLTFRGQELVIDYLGAVIFLPGDFDMPSGTEDDLADGLRVLALGDLLDGGILEASVIVLLPADPDDDDITEVMITDFAFDPPSVLVKEGESVKWTLKTETFHTVTDGMGPEDPLAGQGYNIEFLEFGAMAKIKFDHVEFNTDTLEFNTEFMHSRLIILSGDDEVVVEDVPFKVVNGMAVFPYFSTGAPEETFMVGEVVVMERPEEEDKVTICHIPPGNPSRAHTIRVGRSAVAAHLAHGDVLGPCEEDDTDDDGDFDEDDDDHEDDRVRVCHRGRTLVINENALEAHLRHGDTLGACDDPNDIEVRHDDDEDDDEDEDEDEEEDDEEEE